MKNIKKEIEMVLFLKMLEKIDDSFLIPVLHQKEIFRIKIFKPLKQIEKNSKSQAIKEIADFLKEIRECDHISYRKKFYNEFPNKITQLEKFIFAKITDEEEKEYEKIAELAAKTLKEKIKEETFEKKWEKIKKITDDIKKKKNFLAALGISMNGNKRKH